MSKAGIPLLPSTSQTMRWSSGIYCTGRRDSLPTGQSRIASSYALAEPTDW